MTSLRYLLLCLAFLTVTIACRNKGTEKKTASGFTYKVYRNIDGPKPKIGDYVTIELVNRTADDSILFDSRKSGQPMRFRLERIPFEGSFEEGLTYLSPGDSATFFVPADSLYDYLYKRKGIPVPQEKTTFRPGTNIRFDISLLRIEDYVTAEQEMLQRASMKEKAEQQTLSRYATTQGLDSARRSEGYWFALLEVGNGPLLDSGNVVVVEYTGSKLDGTVVDDSRKNGKAYRFLPGAHQVVRGWELAVKGRRIGDRFRIVLPSSLAYGEEGFSDPRTGTYLIEPYTPLVFDIKIVAQEKVEVNAKK
jgi:FKBP-type peptidyl-prolyl cis-trans isomerase